MHEYLFTLCPQKILKMKKKVRGSNFRKLEDYLFERRGLSDD